MSMPPNKNGTSDPRPRIRFHYLKSTQYRVIHVDGAIGQTTPLGYIHMSLYSERPSIPREQVQQLKEDGSLGEAIPEETVSREGIVREMEVDAIMDINVAQSLKDWLDKQIKELKKRPNIIAVDKEKK